MGIAARSSPPSYSRTVTRGVVGVHDGNAQISVAAASRRADRLWAAPRSSSSGGHDHPRLDRDPVGALASERGGSQVSAVDYSVAGRIANGIAPVFAPIGFNRDIVLALIPAMAAREVAVAAIGTVYAIDDPDSAQGGRAMTDNLRGRWSLPTALAFLMWFVFAPQCISTIAVTRRETNGWRWPAFMVGYCSPPPTSWPESPIGWRSSPYSEEAYMAWQRQQGHHRRQFGRDPESKTFQNGGKVVNLRIATSESGKDKNSGERKEKTSGIRSRSSTKVLRDVANAICARAARSISKARCRPQRQDAQGQDKFSTESSGRFNSC